MKPHRILKAFKGSQTGHDHHHFEPGDNPVPLSDDLAAIVVKEGWAEPFEHKPEPEIAEEKSKGDAPANKARVAAPSNKAK